MKDMETTKICSKCGRELPLECFGKHKRTKDGLQTYCKECQKQYHAEHRDERIEKMKQWRADNAERLKQYWKQYKAEHRDEHKQYMKQYNKQYNTEHAETKKQYNKQYYTTIDGYARNIRHHNLQNDRKYGRCGKDEDPLPSIEQYIELLQQRDYYDKKHYPFNEMGLDRIDNSKAHTLDNVVPCTTEHNRQRGTMPFEEFKAIFIKNGNT